MSLFFKECKKAVCSLTFVIYTAVLLLMYVSQYASDIHAIVPPSPGAESYGTVSKEVPEILMPAAAEGLVREYISGSFKAYPIGFYKIVRPGEKKMKELAGIIYEITGLTEEKLENYANDTEPAFEIIYDGDGNQIAIPKGTAMPEVTVKADMTYEHFRQLMRQADGLIGGGSCYSDEYIVGNFSQVPKTYEDALAEYEEIIAKEKITPSYARLFCDYLGITLGIIPVFAAASFAGKDRRGRMEGLVHSRRISSGRLIFTRFISLVTVMFIPAALLAVHAHVTVKGLYLGAELDNIAFVKYAVVWLLPEILTGTAVGMLLTELFSELAAVFVQTAWWFASVFASTGALTGNITSFNLVPRHNNLYKADLFRQTLRQFTFNRCFYTVLSLVLVIITVMIYEVKRRGGFEKRTHKFFGYSVNKHEA